MSGAVTPDHLVVDTATGRVLHTQVGEKGVAIRAMRGGGTERVVATATDQLCLTAEQTRQLARIGDDVERHYGAPQDIEWAFDPDGKLWLTQARPITTPTAISLGATGAWLAWCCRRTSFSATSTAW